MPNVNIVSSVKIVSDVDKVSNVVHQYRPIIHADSPEPKPVFGSID